MTAWDVSTAFYSNKSLYVGSQNTDLYGIAFSLDGTNIYIVDRGNHLVYQYTLSTAWDLSTAIYSGKSVYVGKNVVLPSGIAFSPDGSNMYLTGLSARKGFQYTLSTAWDISTASYSRKSVDLSDEDLTLYGIAFSSDGLKMYITGNDHDTVFQYDLVGKKATAWDISTAVYSGKSVYVGSQDTNPHGVAFNSDGTKMYIMGYANDTVFQYTLSTAWDISTTVYSGKSKYVGSQASAPHDVAFNSDGTKMYISGYLTDTVYQYTLPEIPPPPPKKEASRTGVYSFKTLKI